MEVPILHRIVPRDQTSLPATTLRYSSSRHGARCRIRDANPSLLAAIYQVMDLSVTRHAAGHVTAR
jgi:hypothetical protein